MSNSTRSATLLLFIATLVLCVYSAGKLTLISYYHRFVEDIDNLLFIETRFWDYYTISCSQTVPTIKKSLFSAEVKVTADTSYKYLDLVLQWAPGSCYNFKYCKKKIPNTWTIHGLWPSVNYTNYPVNCAGSCAPDIAGLPGDLVTKMEKKWPDFYLVN